LTVLEGESKNLCIPKPWELCRPCVSDADCGGADDKCVRLGDVESFCGLACEEQSDCPSGFTCLEVNIAGFTAVAKQCVPSSMQCPCLAMHAGSATTCDITNQWGTCTGKKTCKAGGAWTACEGHHPAPEECNGIDDDCNGVLDDDFDDKDLDGLANCADPDDDGDGVEDAPDNCPIAMNPDQTDTDGDEIGDACDGDDDGDGWPDFYDCDDMDETIFPGAIEEADGVDNNCNGVVDEKPEDPWGTCGQSCYEAGVGPGQDQGFVIDEEHAQGVDKDEKGYLKLEKTQYQLSTIWIANSGESTVSRLSTDTGAEEGRYKLCSDPSRTAVDLEGNVWVTCRADGGVAKVIGYKPACQDKDGDGVVETSEDTNGNGKISGAEMLPQGQDECVAFIVKPGGWCQRAAGVDKENHVWIGDWDGQKIRRLEPTQGATVEEMSVNTNPYGLVIDQKGVIWISGRGTGQLVKADPATDQVKAYTPPNAGGWGFEPYGISLDSKGRIWVADCCMNNKVRRFDPETETWADATAGMSPRGLVAGADGFTYVALDSSNSVGIFDQETMQSQGTINLGGNAFPVGITLDFKGYVWAVNQFGNSASKVDPVTKQIVGTYLVGMGPYTYSDMTGYQLYNYTAPMGEYIHTVQAAEGTKPTWALLNLDIGTPGGTSVDAWVRAGDSMAELENTDWGASLGPFPPTELPVVLSPGLDGVILQVRVRLFPGAEGISPMLKKIWVQYTI